MGHLWRGECESFVGDAGATIEMSRRDGTRQLWNSCQYLALHDEVMVVLEACKLANLTVAVATLAFEKAAVRVLDAFGLFELGYLNRDLVFCGDGEDSGAVAMEDLDTLSAPSRLDTKQGMLERIAERCGNVDLSRLVLFDDQPSNINTATDLGCRAMQVSGAKGLTKSDLENALAAENNDYTAEEMAEPSKEKRRKMRQSRIGGEEAARAEGGMGLSWRSSTRRLCCLERGCWHRWTRAVGWISSWFASRTRRLLTASGRRSARHNTHLLIVRGRRSRLVESAFVDMHPPCAASPCSAHCAAMRLSSRTFDARITSSPAATQLEAFKSRRRAFQASAVGGPIYQQIS